MNTVIKDLDRIDLRILAALGDEGRISWRDLSDKVGLSLTPTLRRVRRLEQEGYITGYGAELDEARFLGAISIFVSVTLDRQAKDALTAFEAEIVKIPQIVSCFMMTGGADYLLRVVVRDLDEYQTLLTDTLTPIPGVAHIQSSFALKKIIERRKPSFRSLLPGRTSL